MNDMPQIERILRIIQILSSGARLTTVSLLRRFEGDVSLRTLQRDFQRIQSSGIPLRSRKTKANENEWFLDSSFKSSFPRTLELNEYLAAYILRENLKVFRNTEIAGEIDSLIDKIEQIVPDDVFMKAEEIDPRHIYQNYGAGMYDYSEAGELIEDLIHAITERKTCFVRYYNADEEKIKSFNIEPHRLLYYAGGLYVIAYTRRFDNFLLLAIQRIQKLAIQEEIFPNEPVFNPQEFWAGKFGLFSGSAVEVTLHFTKSIRHHIEGRIWHASQDISIVENGDLELKMTVGLTPELVSWVLGWSYYVEVLEPDELRSTIRQNLNRMRKLYSKKRSDE